MTEAWLLFDETAIRTAAGNPNGREQLDLPSLTRVEELPDPKGRLRELLLSAAEATGRRRKRFDRDLPLLVQRVAGLIDDFSPLQRLPAFARLMQDCAGALERC